MSFVGFSYPKPAVDPSQSSRFSRRGGCGWRRTFLAIVALSSIGTAVGSIVRADDWPQWRGPKRDGVWRESGVTKKLKADVKPVWRTIIGAGYSAPTVVGDQVFVTDRLLSQGEANPGDPFEKTPVGGVERILCLDDKTGQVRWKHEYPCVYSISYPSGPRAAPTFDDGRLFSLGAMGHFFCLSAVDGKILWRKEFTKTHGAEINVWGMSASPLIDGDNIILLIGGQPDAGVVALDKKTGSEKWRSLSLRDPGYCPPEIFTFGSRRLLIIWSPVAVHALDPSTGKVIWEQPFPLQSALSISSPIVTGDRLFLTAFYNGPMMLRVAPDGGSATIAWRGRSKSELNTDGLHSIMSTPVVDGESIFGVCSFGQLRCLNADTGERIWETIQATGKGRWWNAFIIKHENGYFLANEQGELVLADLKRKGYSEIGRMKLLEPTGEAQRRKVVWSHPAFAHRAVYARNDVEIVKYDLSAKSGE